VFDFIVKFSNVKNTPALPVIFLKWLAGQKVSHFFGSSTNQQQYTLNLVNQTSA
jgi:hypothetical protein